MEKEKEVQNESRETAPEGKRTRVRKNASGKADVDVAEAFAAAAPKEAQVVEAPAAEVAGEETVAE